MAGALYDVHTIKHSFSVGAESTGATVQEGVVCPEGERLLSAFGYVQYAGGAAKAFAIEKYEFGDMVGDPDSEGCWARYHVESEVASLTGTGYIFVVAAKETNPE